MWMSDDDDLWGEFLFVLFAFDSVFILILLWVAGAYSACGRDNSSNNVSMNGVCPLRFGSIIFFCFWPIDLAVCSGIRMSNLNLCCTSIERHQQITVTSHNWRKNVLAPIEMATLGCNLRRLHSGSPVLRSDIAIATAVPIKTVCCLLSHRNGWLVFMGRWKPASGHLFYSMMPHTNALCDTEWGPLNWGNHVYFSVCWCSQKFVLLNLNWSIAPSIE